MLIRDLLSEEPAEEPADNPPVTQEKTLDNLETGDLVKDASGMLRKVLYAFPCGGLYVLSYLWNEGDEKDRVHSENRVGGIWNSYELEKNGYSPYTPNETLTKEEAEKLLSEKLGQTVTIE